MSALKSSFIGENFQQAKKHHLFQVDLVRAIASIGVAAFHLGGKSLPVVNLGWLGVHMFFVLSGFIICWTLPTNFTLLNRIKFILKRIIRIEPVYIASIFLLILLNHIANRDIPDWDNIFLHFFFLSSYFEKPFLNPVYWTLVIEFQFYIFIAVWFSLLTGLRSLIAVILFSLIPVILPVSTLSLSTYFPLFALGMVYCLFSKSTITLMQLKLSGLFISLCIFFSLGLLPAVLGLITLVILALPGKPNAIVSFLAKISFSLYLTHDVVGSRLVVYFGTILPDFKLVKGLIFIAGTGVSILFAFLFFIFIERPFVEFANKLVYRKGTSLLLDDVS